MQAVESPHTLGDLKASKHRVLPVREEMRRNLLARLARSERILPGIIGYDETVVPEIENAVLAGHHIVFLGESCDPQPHRASRPARARGRGLRDQRQSVRADLPGMPPPARRAGRCPADRLDRSRGALRREARHARRVHGGPGGRGRSREGRRGPLPRRRGDDPLRAHPAYEPRRLRDQRAPRPDRKGPGGALQPDGREGRPDQGLQDPPAPRRRHRGERESRGLHEPRPDHHAAQGSLRRPDPHALPPQHRGRDRHRRAGGAAPRSRVVRPSRSGLHEGDRRPAHLRGPRLERDQPVLGCERAGDDQQLRDPPLQCGEARRPDRGARDRPPPDRLPRATGLDGGQDRARVRGRGQEGGRADRAPHQPGGAPGVGQVPQGRSPQAGDRAFRSGLGRGGLGPDARRGVPRGDPPDSGSPGGRGAARHLREPRPHGRRHRVRPRRADGTATVPEC